MLLHEIQTVSRNPVCLCVTGQGDNMKPGAVARADVAAVCVAALTTKAADKITFELSTNKSEAAPAGQTSEIFDDLKQGIYQ